jgi:hypothetical protein
MAAITPIRINLKNLKIVQQNKTNKIDETESPISSTISSVISGENVASNNTTFILANSSNTSDRRNKTKSRVVIRPESTSPVTNEEIVPADKQSVVRERVLLNLPRTQNNQESWHGSIGPTISRGFPNIFHIKQIII